MPEEVTLGRCGARALACCVGNRADAWGAPGIGSSRRDESRRSKLRVRATRGVTLIELLIVAALIALIAGLSYPSAAAGIESMRLRSAADTITNFLSAAIDHAERREQVIEVWISPQDNVLIARSPDLAFQRRLELPSMFHIASIQPTAEVAAGSPRRFLMYPGGTVPRLGIEIVSQSGRRRLVSVDPLSGLPRSELVTR